MFAIEAGAQRNELIDHPRSITNSVFDDSALAQATATVERVLHVLQMIITRPERCGNAASRPSGV